MSTIENLLSSEEAYELFDKSRYITKSSVGEKSGNKEENRMFEDINLKIYFFNDKTKEKGFIQRLSIFYRENMESCTKKVYEYLLKTDFMEKESPDQGKILKNVPGKWIEMINSYYSYALVN